MEFFKIFISPIILPATAMRANATKAACILRKPIIFAAATTKTRSTRIFRRCRSRNSNPSCAASSAWSRLEGSRARAIRRSGGFQDQLRQCFDHREFLVPHAKHLQVRAACIDLAVDLHRGAEFSFGEIEYQRLVAEPEPGMAKGLAQASLVCEYARGNPRELGLDGQDRILTGHVMQLRSVDQPAVEHRENELRHVVGAGGEASAAPLECRIHEQRARAGGLVRQMNALVLRFGCGSGITARESRDVRMQG